MLTSARSYGARGVRAVRRRVRPDLFSSLSSRRREQPAPVTTETVRFPGCPDLSVDAQDLSFAYAEGAYMHKLVANGRWEYERDVLALLLNLTTSSESAVLVNVGANIGYFPIVMGKALGRRIACFAYEPMPELTERVRRGAADNGVPMMVSGAALSDHVGTAPFYLSSKTDSSNSLNRRFRPFRSVIDVDVSTLDHESAVGAIPRPDPETRTVLLLDTESTEASVIRGGREFIRRTQPAIICEVLAGRSEPELAELLEELDYRPYRLTEDRIEAADEIVGDPTYAHRDWLFLPSGEQPPDSTAYAATVSSLGELSR